MAASRNGEETVGQDETFVTLMQVAEADPEIRKRLVAILSLDSFHRKSVVNTYLRELGLKKAPEKLIRALSRLLDDEVAEEARALLEAE